MDLCRHCRPVGECALIHSDTSFGRRLAVLGSHVHNTRNAEDEHVLDSSRVAELTPLWTVTTDGNVTATPAVVDGLVYAPDFGGSLWAVDAVTGKVIWKNAISSYTGVAGDVSRTTPAYWRGALIMGEGAQTVST